jgi:hypothetical protein
MNIQAISAILLLILVDSLSTMIPAGQTDQEQNNFDWFMDNLDVDDEPMFGQFNPTQTHIESRQNYGHLGRMVGAFDTPSRSPETQSAAGQIQLVEPQRQIGGGLISGGKRRWANGLEQEEQRHSQQGTIIGGEGSSRQLHGGSQLSGDAVAVHHYPAQQQKRKRPTALDQMGNPLLQIADMQMHTYFSHNMNGRNLPTMPYHECKLVN